MELCFKKIVCFYFLILFLYFSSVFIEEELIIFVIHSVFSDGLTNFLFYAPYFH